MNAIVMADIYESPKKDVNTTYATHFLDYKGMVSTEYMTNYIESEAQIELIQDPLMQLDFLHFSMVPKHLTVEYYEPRDQYYCNFELDVSLRKENNIIHQYTKSFPMYFDKDRYDFVRLNGIALEDSFPVAEGEYKLILLIQNSVGKEFSVFEQKVIVPEKSEKACIAGPFLGYKFEDYKRTMHLPFKLLDRKLVVDPKNTFSASEEVVFVFSVANVSDDLWKNGKVEVLISTVGKDKTPVKSFAMDLKKFPYHRIMSIYQSLQASDLAPNYYEMKLTLLGRQNEILDERRRNFIISPAQNISHPVAHAKGFSFSESFLYYYMLANQYEKLEKYQKAEKSFKKAFELNPKYKKGLIEYANFLFKISRFSRILELTDLIKEDEILRFEYNLLKGKALMGLGKYAEAVHYLLEGNKMYNSHIGLLNSLGFCYYKLNEKEEALRVLKASLRLDPSQADTKKLIEIVEKNR
jgi:tetratricopeptide (TPR) repeat protein